MAETTRLAVLLPDPGRLWVRYAPRAWPGPDTPWTNFATADLGEPAPAAVVEVERPLDDLLYLPPAAAGGEEARRALAVARLAEGTPVLWQLAPGEEAPLAGLTAVYDLLPALLDRDLDALDQIPGGGAAVWPLAAGLTDDPELCRRGCERLAAAGVAVAQPLPLELSPASSRRLAEGRGEPVFKALFHRPPPAAREFARVAAGCGLGAFLPRPLPRLPLGGAANREIAGALLLAAELWLALDRPVGQGLALARAGRWADAAAYDLAALAREGNLGVVPELDASSRAVIEELAAAGRSGLLAELLSQYTSPDGAPSEGRDGAAPSSAGVQAS